jgi:class 3 adenylate cyclase/CHASE2 domain-containing sensor protein
MTLDVRWTLRGHEAGEDGVVVVALDDASLAAAGEPNPPRHRYYAKLVTAVRKLGPSKVVFDIDLPTSSDHIADDEALLTALSEFPSGRAFVPISQVQQGQPVFLAGLASPDGRSPLSLSGATPYHTSEYVSDDDGGLRRIDLESSSGIPALVPAATNGPRHGVRWLDLPHRPCALEDAPAASRYDCPTPAFSAAGVLDGVLPRSGFRGRVAVIGFTGRTRLEDRPTWGAARITPAELNAHAIGTALRGWPVRSSAGWIAILGALLLALGPALAESAGALRRRSADRLPSAGAGAASVAALGFGLCAVWTLLACTLFGTDDRILPLVAPVGAGLTSTALASVAIFYISREHTQAVYAVAASFAPEQLIQEILLRRSSKRLHPGTDTRTLTILFADLRGSGRYIETLPDPATAYRFLQTFLSEAIDIVHRENGYVQSLEGDGILAVFGFHRNGDPADQQGRAVRAATELADRIPGVMRGFIDAHRHTAWAREIAELSVRIPPGVRVGVNTGEVSSGTAGSAKEARLAFVTIGRTTHRAAQLEGTGKKGHWLERAPDRMSDPETSRLAAGAAAALGELAGSPHDGVVVIAEETMTPEDGSALDAGLRAEFLPVTVDIAKEPAATKLDGQVLLDVWVRYSLEGEALPRKPATPD